jgi:hypothetical protein
MAALDLPGSVLSSVGPTWPISANSGRGPWAGANFLVVGPAGSGKLSLVRAISLASDPRTRLVLLDFETEPESQHALLDQLGTLLSRDQEATGEQPGNTIVFRHIHRLSQRALARLIEMCRSFSQPPGRAPVVFHATSHQFADYPKALRRKLRSLFNCLVQWSGFPSTETRIRQFVTDVIADLNRRHGPHILGVDPPVVDLVQRISQRANLYQLRNVIERAYFREESSCLSVAAVTAACPMDESRVSRARSNRAGQLRRAAGRTDGRGNSQVEVTRKTRNHLRTMPPPEVLTRDEESIGSHRQHRKSPSGAFQPVARADSSSRKPLSKLPPPHDYAAFAERAVMHV